MCRIWLDVLSVFSTSKMIWANSIITKLYYMKKLNSFMEQAQDWSEPIDVNVADKRLQGDYKVMADFVLSQMIQNAEARNEYLRQLKAIHWDEFLNIDRLDKDRAQKYVETEQMLKQVHLLAAPSTKSKPSNVKKTPWQEPNIYQSDLICGIN